MAIVVFDDPFADYPELRKEREKLRRIEAFKEKGYKGHGGYRPGAGRPKETQKLFRTSFLINKEDEQELLVKINELKEKYQK